MPESALSLVDEKELLSPKIFSAVLRLPSVKDRLNLRLCSRTAERAVAHSEMQLPGCCISGRNGKLAIDYCGGLKIKIRIGEVELEELIKFRNRLFTTVIVKYVKIVNVNFNTVSIAIIERFLEGFQFLELSLTIKREEYNLDVIEFLMKHYQKKIALEVHGFTLDCTTLLDFEPMQKLRILNFLDLVKQRYMILEIPVAFTSGRAIRDALEIISAYNGQQCVHFSSNPILMDRFLLDIGIRRTNRAVLQMNDFSEFELIKPSNTGIISPALFSSSLMDE